MPKSLDDKAASSHLDVAAIAKATAGLCLGARRATSRLSGLHAIRRPGDALSFAEHRPYHAGDDPRRIDYRTSARHEGLWVKNFEDEAAVAVEVVVDLTPSMRFGEHDPHQSSKRQRALEWAVALACLAGKSSEAAGLVGLCPEPKRLLHASTRPRPADSFAKKLAGPCLGRAGDVAHGLGEAAALLAPRSWVVFITDGIADEGALQSALRVVASRHRTLTVIHLIHPEEHRLIGSGHSAVTLVDLESEATIDLLPGAQKEYAARVEVWLKKTAAVVAAAHGHHLVQSTAMPLAQALAELMRHQAHHPLASKRS